MTDSKTYEDGILEGKLEVLSVQGENHNRRIDWHEKRLRLLERIVWGLVAIPTSAAALIFFIQILPLLVRIAEGD